MLYNSRHITILPLVLICAGIILYNTSVRASYNLTDTSIVRKQIEYASKLAPAKPDSGIFILNKLHKNMHRLPENLQADIISATGRAYYFQGTSDSAFKYIDQANAMYRQINDQEGLGRTMMNKSALYFSMADFDMALIHQDSALVIIEKYGDKNLLKRIYYNMSNLFKVKGAYDESLYYIDKGLELAEEMNDTLHICYLYSMLGLIHTNLGHTQTARSYYMKALQFSQKIHSEKIEMMSYERLGHLYNNMGNNEEALNYFKKALKLSQNLNNFGKTTEILANIGGTYNELGQVNKALYYFQKALKISKEKKITTSFIQATLNIVNIDIQQKKYHQAITKLDSLDKLVHQSNYHYYIARFHNLYSKAQAELTDYKSAYDHLVISNNLTDSLFNEEIRNEFSSLAFSYQYKMRTDSLKFASENRIKQQQAEVKRRKRNTKSIILLSMLFIIASSLALYFVRLKQKRKESLLKDDLLLYQQKALSQQISPVFIMKILNSIKQFIQEKETKESMDYIADFAQLMRLTLYNLHGHLIILKDELEVLDLFLNIEKIKFENRIEIIKIIDHNVDIEKAHIPSLLFQSVADNLLKINDINPDINAKFSYKITHHSEMLNCIFENTCSALNEKQYMKKTDNSLVSEITRKRFDLLSTYYKKKFDYQQLQYIDEHGATLGLRVELDLPLVRS